jgi:hypothetical protein
VHAAFAASTDFLYRPPVSPPTDLSMGWITPHTRSGVGAPSIEHVACQSGVGGRAVRTIAWRTRRVHSSLMAMRMCQD